MFVAGVDGMSANHAPDNGTTKLRAWLDAGAHGKLSLYGEDFAEDDCSLNGLLFSGSWRQRLAQRWRSYCAWMGRYTPFSGWKEFWFRRAGVNIGKNVFFSPGTEIDLLFPQLITFEDDAVTGMGALIVAHVFTPGKLLLSRTTVKRGGMVGARAVLAITSIGENGVLGANSCTIAHPIPDGHTGIGTPVVCHKHEVLGAKGECK